MGSDALAVLRRAATPFLAGAAAAAALLHGLYATATLGLLVGLWAAALVQQAVARRVAPAAAPAPPITHRDADEQRRLTHYLDLSPAPLVALDGRDRLRMVNRAARRLLRVETLMPDPPATLVAAIAATRPGSAATVGIDTGSGMRAFAILTADVDRADGPARIAALVDIEADLKAAEAATLRDLVQVLAHEITNTLTPIASLSATAAAMMEETPVDLPAIRAAVETVARRAEGLQRFGGAYRDLARLPPPTVARVDVARLIEDLGQLFAARWPQVALAVSVEPPILVADLDADQLSQAIWALLQNAAEAGRHVDLRVALRGADIMFRIADDGPGIVAADADAIFRPFFTTKASGSGIGLAIARQVFRGHGGDLVLAAPAPGETAFEATMPDVHAAPSPSSGAPGIR